MRAQLCVPKGVVKASASLLPRAVLSSMQSASLFTTTTKSCDYERWYGHLMDFDVANYKYTGELPQWQRYSPRTDEEDFKMAMDNHPDIELGTTHECLIFDADRLNPKLNRKEFGNEIKIRLEKQANTVSRGQQLVAKQQYTDQATEDTMIARIADEEHVHAEMKYVKTLRVNELAEDNRLDILPGGHPNSLREKTRWNTNQELHPVDRKEIGARLMAWLPEKYHVVYFDDFATVAANDKQSREEMFKVIANVETEMKEEAKKNNWEADLSEEIAELKNTVDPTHHITKATIDKEVNLDTLDGWAREVYEYNGDERMICIYERAAELTGNQDHKDLVKTMKALLKVE